MRSSHSRADSRKPSRCESRQRSGEEGDSRGNSGAHVAATARVGWCFFLCTTSSKRVQEKDRADVWNGAARGRCGRRGESTMKCASRFTHAAIWRGERIRSSETDPLNAPRRPPAEPMPASTHRGSELIFFLRRPHFCSVSRRLVLLLHPPLLIPLPLYLPIDSLLSTSSSTHLQQWRPTARLAPTTPSPRATMT